MFWSLSRGSPRMKRIFFRGWNLCNKKSEVISKQYKWQQRYANVIEHLNLNPEHRAHDGRKHFITKAKKYKVDEYAIKYMVGHKITDVTEAVYTVREPEWLRQEIEKIK